MASSTDRLDPLQRDLLGAFFAHAEGWFLTGGAALAGFYLAHRTTRDLDLFAPPEVSMADGVEALHAACAQVGAVATALRQHGDFRRFAVARGAEQTLVDLVVDRAPQLPAEKPRFGAVRVDSLRDIAANKLCALLDRVEARDLVDLRLLLEHGPSLEELLRDAQSKHAGADPATLAWVLGTWRLPPTAPLPEGSTLAEVESFRESLITALARLALPLA